METSRSIADQIAASQALAAQPSYLEGLNAEQRQAVEQADGPVLVLAGAGTGKTRVLTTRIAHLLWSRRARPNEILAVTFTNKAAREMKERIGRLLGGVAEGMPWLGTFHSIGMRILRRHAELVGLAQNFTILDVDDQIRLVKQLIQAEKLDEKRWPARQLAGLIDGWKNKGLVPEKVPAGEAYGFANGRGIEFYAAYQKRLKELNAADFGDLLLENLRLFREHPDVLSNITAGLLTSWWTSIKTLTSRNISGSGCWRRAATISAAWATTINPSMAGAAPRWTTFCASKRIFRVPRWSGWSAITAPPHIY